MPLGHELMLGFEHADFIKLLPELGLSLAEGEDYDEGMDFSEDSEAVLKDLNKKLEGIWFKCLKDDLKLNVWKARIKRPHHSAFEDVYLLPREGLNIEPGKEVELTTKDVREIKPWGIGLYYDPDEVGDDEKSAVLGISLISRYYPTFLDHAEEHGGSGDNIVLSAETLKNIEAARNAITAVIPQWIDAQIIIKNIFY